MLSTSYPGLLFVLWYQMVQDRSRSLFPQAGTATGGCLTGISWWGIIFLCLLWDQCFAGVSIDEADLSAEGAAPKAGSRVFEKNEYARREKGAEAAAS